MTKEKYLEKLSKMDGLDLIDELANRKRANEINGVITVIDIKTIE